MQKVTEKQKTQLIRAFERFWSKRAACNHVGVHPRTWFKIEARDPDFKAAAECAVGKMVREARGRLSDLIRANSLAAITFFLKNYDPALRERKEKGPPPIPLEEVTDEELEAYAKLRERQRRAKIK